MMRDRLLSFLTATCVAAACAPNASAQWDPRNGSWNRERPRHVRVMTWNVEDALCSTNDKLEETNSGFNNWHALARTVAAFQPDVLLLQETADNSGNGSGSGVDSVSRMLVVLDLFLHGGVDPYLSGNPNVTAYVQKYAPAFDLPYIFVSSNTDGFNRNVLLSRFPLKDLNGDGKSTYSDIPFVSADKYAPGGDGGIRGFQFAELDLPDGLYRGDLVVGNAHLKAGGGSNDEEQRLEAAQNVAYFIDYWYNGANAGTVDPRDKISDSPKATTILDPYTPVVYGGDWNEDENGNGRRGPAEWLVEAKRSQDAANDGTDRDRSDNLYDDARNPITGERNTRSGSKLDYLAHQDSIALSVREFIFESDDLEPQHFPPEIAGFPDPVVISSWASDHLPVVADYDLPACPIDAAWALYGPGHPGTQGIPAIAASAPPVLGTTIQLQAANSPGFATSGALYFGLAPTFDPKPWGGAVLVRSATITLRAVPVAGFDETLAIPDQTGLCGLDIYFQLLQSDIGASAGIASTRGLHLTLGR